MIKATKIRMHKDEEDSNNLTGIEAIYLEGDIKSERFYLKESVHDFLDQSEENIIVVNHEPYPKLVPRTTQNGHKYVKSERNETEKDNLLKLPRE